MSENTVTTSASGPALFGKSNYMWMLLGVVVIALGMFLMAGGRSENPAEFKPEEVYSTTRITVAPILIFIGLAIECYAIFKKSK
jgi:heme/copper-type cytochrome/quinol oxidase subunit 2